MKTMDPLARALLDEHGARTRSVGAGELLLCEGQLASAVGVIIDGHAWIGRNSGKRPVIIAGLGPGDCFGDISALTGTPSAWDVRAVDVVWVVETEASAFRRRVESDRRFAKAYATSQVDRARVLYERLAEALAGKLDDRILLTLRRLAGETHQFAITQKTLADLVGARRTSVNRVIRRLRDEGRLSTERAGMPVSADDPRHHLSTWTRPPSPRDSKRSPSDGSARLGTAGSWRALHEDDGQTQPGGQPSSQESRKE